ncbi:MAG: molecular chaperone TorD family protein [Gammaproteobacteria bacterium]|nr:molecular chaperone TorD family protein [Gammaproteobacteria bacterium]MCW8840600.1 molecular chaperone TorD family protein [Gammaproteobacteria bacterium]MCW8928405.1 molecular chaperone TorD family protein [Gammaproteobacteria bacterium]MCW8957702.1 molecular chaperone TorD family protein [Gammaproteobacteria bacterium]MCW8972429.1 molecular chaperone TorD family protein [Gammaproteobacteria bacterium]
MIESREQPNTIDELKSRAHWYRLLAGVFAEEPQAPFLRELRSQACIESLAEVGVSFGEDFLATDEEMLLDDLAAEYTMLFVAPGGFPPVESVRLQGGYRQSASSEVRDAYTAEGFSVQSGRFAIFDDHLAAQMQFVAALLERQAEALAAAEEQEARRLEKTVKRFWIKHLGRWCRGYAQLVEEAAEHSFYREMARLLDAFVTAELDIMGLDVADEDGGKLRAPKPKAVTEPMQCGGAAT